MDAGPVCLEVLVRRPSQDALTSGLDLFSDNCSTFWPPLRGKPRRALLRYLVRPLHPSSLAFIPSLRTFRRSLPSIFPPPSLPTLAFYSLPSLSNMSVCNDHSAQFSVTVTQIKIKPFSNCFWQLVFDMLDWIGSVRSSAVSGSKE